MLKGLALRAVGGWLVKWLGGGTLVAMLALGAGWLWHDWQTGKLEARLSEARGEAAQLRTSRDEWREAAEQRLDELERVREERQAAREAAALLQAQLEHQDERYSELREQIRNAPSHEDGPVAPVLRQVLEGLP